MSPGDVESPLAFAVYCTKLDGRRALFQKYRTRAEAEGVAAALRRVRCPCVVVGPDELALEARDGLSL